MGCYGLGYGAMKEEHPTREAARAELFEHGFTEGFASSRRPNLYVPQALKQSTPRLAVLRDREHGVERWRIVPYPEPAVCSPGEAAELEKRDGIVLPGGRDPVAKVEESEVDWLDDETSWLE